MFVTMLNNQLNINYNKFDNLVRTAAPYSLPNSLLSPYLVSGINFGLKQKKASKQFVLKLSLWAQMDLNHRPSDYESDALTN